MTEEQNILAPENNYSGKHLILDLELSDESIPLISSREPMSEIIERIVEKADMILAIPPVAMKFPFSAEINGLVKRLKQEGVNTPTLNEWENHIARRDTTGSGVSSLGLITTSHIAAHGWDELKYLSLDFFSCKTFDEDVIIDLIDKFFKCKRLNCTVLERKIHGLPEIKTFTREGVCSDKSLALAS